tara:strand:+ start:229 stop:753 length:525 start_codon:yes stop_codon:yes gene_type:complete
MIKLIQINNILLERWFTLPLETVDGFPLATGARGADFIYHMTKANLAIGVPDRWSYRYFILCEESRQIVGTIGFRSGPSDGFLEVGYRVSPDHTGKGIASEALKKLIEISLSNDPELGFKAHIFSDNEASIRVVQKAGFKFEGPGKDEAYRDRVVYKLQSESALALYGMKTSAA